MTDLVNDQGKVAGATLVLSILSLEGTFQGSVTAWSGRQWAATGQVPELYEAPRAWVNGTVQPVYVLAYLLAMAGFGWAALQAGLPTPWVGWASLGWSLLWLVGYRVGAYRPLSWSSCWSSALGCWSLDGFGESSGFGDGERPADDFPLRPRSDISLEHDNLR